MSLESLIADPTKVAAELDGSATPPKRPKVRSTWGPLDDPAAAPPATPLPGYDAWKLAPSPDGLRGLVTSLQPTIGSALRRYGVQENPNVLGRARVVAADAVHSFDPAHGVDLRTHVARQLQRLQREAPKINDPLPQPERLRRDRAQVLNATSQLADQLGRDVTDEEVARHLTVPVHKVRKIRGMPYAQMPLSAAEGEDEDDDRQADVVASESTPFDEWVDAVYHGLNDRDRYIFEHRGGYQGRPKLSVGEIASKLKIDPSAVSRRATALQAQLDSFYG